MSKNILKIGAERATLAERVKLAFLTCKGCSESKSLVDMLVELLSFAVPVDREHVNVVITRITSEIFLL